MLKRTGYTLVLLLKSNAISCKWVKVCLPNTTQLLQESSNWITSNKGLVLLLGVSITFNLVT